MVMTRQPRLRPIAALTAIAAIPSAAIAQQAAYNLASISTGVIAESVTAPGYPGQQAIMSGGLTIGDFNNDTYPDIFILGLGTSPDKLFINNQDGTFTDRAPEWGIDRMHKGMGAAVGDINNDGYPELYITSFGPATELEPVASACILYLNNGPDEHGQFSMTDIAEPAGVNNVLDIPGGMTPAFGDIDLDGDLDLFVATWEYFPNGNRLFENDFMQTGALTFQDITRRSMEFPERNFITRGFTPHIVDINGDRYPEILLSADFATSELWVNNGPNEAGRATFRTTTNKSNIAEDHNAMGALVEDLNGDGLLDWFQTNIFVESSGYGNTLYICQELDDENDPIYHNDSALRGVKDNGWGWGVVAGDFDNDQDPDIIATNGWTGWPNKPTRYWTNADGQGSAFVDLPVPSGLYFNINGRSLVKLDHDKDGDLDLVVADNQGPVRFYRNDLAHADGFTNYLRVRLDTSNHPCMAPLGQGAMVRATVSGKTQLHPVHNNASFLGQSEIATHIGMGTETMVETLTITWNDGVVTTLHNIPANQEITISKYHKADINEDGDFDFYDASAFLSAHRAGIPSADFDQSGTIDNNDVAAFVQALTNPCPSR